LGRKEAGLKEHWRMFDYKLLIYATNTIAGIVHKAKLVKTAIYVQRISAVPVEKKFGKTRMHAGVHRMVVELVKTMEDNEAMQFINVQDQVKNRRLAYGETISPCACLTGIGMTPLIDVEAFLHIVEFLAMISPLLGETTTDEFHIFAEKLMSDALFPFAQTNFSMMNAQKLRPGYQTPRSRPFVSPHHSFLKIRDEGSDWMDSS
jgi:hypothetical protein